MTTHQKGFNSVPSLITTNPSRTIAALIKVLAAHLDVTEDELHDQLNIALAYQHTEPVVPTGNEEIFIPIDELPP